MMGEPPGERRAAEAREEDDGRKAAGEERGAEVVDVPDARLARHGTPR